MRSNERGRALAVVVPATAISRAIAMVLRAKIQMSHCNWANLTFLREFFFYPLVHRKLLQTTHFFQFTCALFFPIFCPNFCYSFENDNSGSQAHRDTQHSERKRTCNRVSFVAWKRNNLESRFFLLLFIPLKRSTINERKASSLSLSIQSSYLFHCRQCYYVHCYFALVPLATTKHNAYSFHSSMLNKSTSLSNGSHRQKLRTEM